MATKPAEIFMIFAAAIDMPVHKKLRVQAGMISLTAPVKITAFIVMLDLPELPTLVKKSEPI